MNIHSRLPDVGTTIFTVMSKMAQDYGAINLSQGFPDFPIDKELIHLVSESMLANQNQYAPMPGLPALRSAIADVVSKTYSRSVDPDTEITVTAGATEGLYSAVAALIHPGDEVIVFDPAYDSYDPAIRLNGGVPVHINLHPPHFTIDWDLVRKNINSKTRMIMINTPHNPTGAVLSAADLNALEEIVHAHDLVVLSDEVYERIIFDNKTHYGVLRSPALVSNSVAVFSFGKTFHATGWKVGYVVAPPTLTTEIRKTHQFITFSVNTPIQCALAAYLKNPEHYLQLGSFFQQKRDFFLEQLKGSSFEPLPCYGSYFQLVSYSALSNRPDWETATEITQKYKVASIPVSVFYKDKSDHKLLRFCFAKEEKTLEQATAILRKI